MVSILTSGLALSDTPVRMTHPTGIPWGTCVGPDVHGPAADRLRAVRVTPPIAFTPRVESALSLTNAMRGRDELRAHNHYGFGNPAGVSAKQVTVPAGVPPRERPVS